MIRAQGHHVSTTSSLRAVRALTTVPTITTVTTIAAIAIVGCTHPPPAAPATTTPIPPEVQQAIPIDPARPEAVPLLARDAAIASAEGALSLNVVGADFGTEGDRIAGFVTLQPNACLLAFARGSETVDDIDLIAFGDDGTVIASDEAPDPRPTLLLCPPQPGRTYLSARVSSGRGLVALGVQAVPIPLAGKVGTVLNARGRPGDVSGRIEAWPGLDAKAHQFRRDLGGKWEEVRRIALPVDPRAPSFVSTSIDAGRCISVLAVPSEEVTTIDVQLLDANGRITTRGTERDRDRIAILCSSINTNVTVEVQPHVGAGAAAVVISRSLPGTEPDMTVRAERIDVFATSDVAAGKKSLADRLKPAGYGAATAHGSAKIEVGRRASATVDLPRGCARIDVVGGTPAAGLLGDLWGEKNDGGTLLAHGEGGAIATLFSCGDGGKARLDLEGTARSGPVGWEVRAEPNPPATFASGGIAAARLLARFNTTGAVVPASALQQIKSLALDPSGFHAIKLNVAAKHCVDVGAASAPGGSRLEVRIIDTNTRDEIASSRGLVSTLVHTCSDTTARDLTAEVRLGLGRGDVMIATRTTD